MTPEQLSLIEKRANDDVLVVDSTRMTYPCDFVVDSNGAIRDDELRYVGAMSQTNLALFFVLAWIEMKPLAEQMLALVAEVRALRSMLARAEHCVSTYVSDNETISNDCADEKALRVEIAEALR